MEAQVLNTFVLDHLEWTLYLQFNECILLFSDMPTVDIDNVVSTSMEVEILHFTLVAVPNTSLFTLFEDRM